MLSPIPNPTLRRMLALVPAAMATVLLAACGSSSSDSGTAATKPKVAVFLPVLNGYDDVELRGIKAAVGKAGGTVDGFSADFDLAKQVTQIQDAITTGRYDAFVIEPVDSGGISSSVAAAKAAKIPVVAQLAPIGPDLTKVAPQVAGVVSSVVQPADRVGATQSKLVRQACAGKQPCRVAVIAGSLKLPDDKLKTSALKEALSDDEQIEFVATQDADYDPAKALQVTQNLLQAEPDLDVIVTGGDPMADGAQIAVDKAGKAVALVGLGGSVSGTRKVASGDWVGTVAYLPYTTGLRAGEQAVAAARGAAVKPAIDMTGPVITKDNAARFKAEWDD